MRLSSWLAPLLLVPTLAIADGTVYRWTDANGQTHFSQTPPGAGKKYDMIQGKRAPSTTPPSADGSPAGPSADDVRNKEQEFIRNAEAERKSKAEAKAKEKADRETARTKCNQARERVTFLEERTARRLVTKADDGNYARMNEDEFMKRLDDAKREVSSNCGASS
jgi:hypothetical protein